MYTSVNFGKLVSKINRRHLAGRQRLATVRQPMSAEGAVQVSTCTQSQFIVGEWRKLSIDIFSMVQIILKMRRRRFNTIIVIYRSFLNRTPRFRLKILKTLFDMLAYISIKFFRIFKYRELLPIRKCQLLVGTHCD